MTAGFDAQKEEYCDLIDSGIIDPTKVVRPGLRTRSATRASSPSSALPA